MDGLGKTGGGAVAEECGEEKPKFKFIKKKRPIRTRKASDDSEGNAETRDDEKDTIMQETLEIQKLRKRPKGVNAAALALGKKVTKMDSMVDSDNNDPFKGKGGGLLTLEEAKRVSEREQASDGGIESQDSIGTQFSKETRVRDEDEEMRKFIEKEMEKRRRGSRPAGSMANTDATEEEGAVGAAKTYMSPEDLALASLPTHLKTSTSKNEEMLSSQMLSGIPEVDLGIDEKIRNIEATEAAKKKAAEERIRKARSGAPSEFVPTNLAVNFRQANRFKQSEGPDSATSGEHEKSKRDPGSSVPGNQSKKSEKDDHKLITQRTVVVGQVPQERLVAVDSKGNVVKDNDPNRATDDLHLTQFKKHFQRK